MNTTEFIEDEFDDCLPSSEEAAPAATSLPMFLVHGEGYVTRKDGTVVPFTISNETK